MSSMCIVVSFSWNFYCPVLEALCDQNRCFWIDELVLFVNLCPVCGGQRVRCFRNLDGLFVKLEPYHIAET